MWETFANLLPEQNHTDSKTGTALWFILGFLAIGIWVNLVGYTSTFQAVAQTDPNYPVVRFAYHVGRIAVALSFLAFPLFYSLRRNALIIIVPLAICFGTASFGFAYHQTLINPLFLAAFGSFLMGFGYNWVIATLSVFLAEGYSMKAAVIVLTASQIIEQIASIGVNFVVPDAYLILVCPLLPLIALVCFSIIYKRTQPRPRKAPLSGIAKRHQIILLVTIEVAVVALGAVSNVGIWGTQRPDYLTPSPGIPFAETILACLIVFALARTTLYLNTKEPLSFRYQIPFLVILAGFLVVVLQQYFPSSFPGLYSTLLMAVEYFSHIFVAVIAVSAMQDLDTPPYRTCGIGMSVYSILSLAWILLLENAPQSAGAVITIFCFLLVIIIAGHPRLLYKRTANATTSLAELNEYTLEGETEIPLESNGKTAADAVAGRCDYLGAEYGLSKREQQVFVLLAQGRTRPTIQEILVLSEGTTKTHISHIYAKMGVNSHQELLDLVFGPAQG